MPSVFSLNIMQCDLKFLFFFFFPPYVGVGLLYCSIGNLIITNSFCRFNNGLYKTHGGLGNFDNLLFFSDLEIKLSHVFGDR